jgi:hypothetical protein
MLESLSPWSDSAELVKEAEDTSFSSRPNVFDTYASSVDDLDPSPGADAVLKFSTLEIRKSDATWSAVSGLHGESYACETLTGKNGRISTAPKKAAYRARAASLRPCSLLDEHALTTSTSNAVLPVQAQYCIGARDFDGYSVE